MRGITDVVMWSPLPMKVSKRLGIMTCFVVGAGVVALGCQSEVPKSDLDAISAWSTAICACADKSGAAAKTCAAGVKKPAFETMSGGRPKYKLESVAVYDAAAYRGTVCQAKIP